MGIQEEETRNLCGNRLSLGTIRRREVIVSIIAYVFLLKILSNYEQKVMGTFHGRKLETTTNRGALMSSTLKEEKIRVYVARSLQGLNILHDLSVPFSVQMLPFFYPSLLLLSKPSFFLSFILSPLKIVPGHHMSKQNLISINQEGWSSTVLLSSTPMSKAMR